MVLRGFSEPYGFWKMYWICAARLGAARPGRGLELGAAEPDRCRSSRGAGRRSPRAVVVLPDPDSPTTARHSCVLERQVDRVQHLDLAVAARPRSRASGPPSRRRPARASTGSPTLRLLLRRRPRAARMQRALCSGRPAAAAGPPRRTRRCAWCSAARRRSRAVACPAKGRGRGCRPGCGRRPAAGSHRPADGCRGGPTDSKSSSAGPSSTTRPAYMTATRRATAATTARSWLT